MGQLGGSLAKRDDAAEHIQKIQGDNHATKDAG